MVGEERALLIERAAQRIHPDYTHVLERLVECEGGERYLKERIIKAPDIDSLTANSRVLKYANYLVEGGARVTFVREGRGKTPDLMALVDGITLFLEVRRFRTTDGSAAKHPVEKIVGAVTTKRGQLPPSEIGFVAIDNFDLGLESHDARGFTHDHIVDGLCELERCAKSNPEGWRSPSGVIVAAMSTMGSGTIIHRPPHFVWINRGAECPPPAHLVDWLLSSLHSGRLFEATNECSSRGLGGMPAPMIT
jgi:hypothetical protein